MTQEILNSSRQRNWTVVPEGTKAISLTINCNGGTFILPWHSFIAARGSDDKLIIEFQSYSLELYGEALGRLLTDLSQQRVQRIINRPENTLVTGLTVNKEGRRIGHWSTAPMLYEGGYEIASFIAE